MELFVIFAPIKQFICGYGFFGTLLVNFFRKESTGAELNLSMHLSQTPPSASSSSGEVVALFVSKNIKNDAKISIK